MISEAQQLTITVRFPKYPSDFTSHIWDHITAACDAAKGLKKDALEPTLFGIFSQK